MHVHLCILRCLTHTHTMQDTKCMARMERSCASLTMYVLQCVAVCCIVLQCVAACCSLLHYVVVACAAVFCSVRQCVAETVRSLSRITYSAHQTRAYGVNDAYSWHSSRYTYTSFYVYI